MAVTGLGATFVLATNPVSMRIRSIAPAREFVEILDDTALSSTGYKEWVPDDIADWDTFELEFYYDGTMLLPVAKPQTATLTFAKSDVGAASGAILAGTGFFSDGATPIQEVSQRNLMTGTWKWDGKTNVTFTPES